MRLIWQLHRRTLVAAGVAVVLAVAAISLAIGSGRHHATGDLAAIAGQTVG